MSTVIYNIEGRPLLYVPDFFAGQATKLLKYVNAATTSDADTRKKICSREPLIFALVYCRHMLKAEETGGRYSLNPLHIFLAESAATYWPFPLEPKECRVGVVAPRDSGKSTWVFRILPLWGACYGWRVFQVFFAVKGERAERHLANLRHELHTNALINEDFPELCAPARRRGRVVADNRQHYESESGVTFMARGIDAGNLGLNEMGSRPDLLVGDDLEPLGKYSFDSQKDRLSTFINGVLPMNLRAAVYLIGTVVRYGSIMHEVVQAATGGGMADWIREEGFDCQYWPAYTIDLASGVPESFWPEKWPMDFILREEGFASFQLNFMNQPAVAGTGLWRQQDMHYGCPFRIDTRVLVIDPAVTSKDTSDETGIAVVGFDGAGYNAFVEYAKGVRLDPERLRELVRLIIDEFRPDTVIIETIQGGDYVIRQLQEVIPKYVRLAKSSESNDYRSKAVRIRELHEWCQRKWVFLNTTVHAFVDQALAWPDVKHDDVIDAVAKAVHHRLKDRPLPQAPR